MFWFEGCGLQARRYGLHSSTGGIRVGSKDAQCIGLPIRKEGMTHADVRASWCVFVAAVGPTNPFPYARCPKPHTHPYLDPTATIGARNAEEYRRCGAAVGGILFLLCLCHAP